MADETVFRVRRARWLRAGDGWLRLPGETVVATHPTAAAAEADRVRREATARRVVQPFRCGTGLWSRTSLDADRLHDWFLDAGVEPPADRDWAAWWDAHEAGLSDAAWSRLWAGLDRLRFFDVVAEPALPVVHVVLEIRWYEDEYEGVVTAEPEGGTPTEAHRTARLARLEADEWHQSRRTARWRTLSEPSWGSFDRGGRVRQAADPFDPATPTRDEDVRRVSGDAVRFFDVAEVPVVGGTGTRGRRSRLHIVTRLGWGEAEGRFRRDYQDGGTPMMAFHDRAEARDFAEEEDQRVRRVLSPFAFASGGMVGEVSALAEREFIDSVVALGLPPPPEGRYHVRDWQAWWDAGASDWSASARDGVWGLCHRLAFHAVTGVDLED